MSVTQQMGVFDQPGKNQMIPMPLRTDSMTAAAITEPICPPALAPMACISRWIISVVGFKKSFPAMVPPTESPRK